MKQIKFVGKIETIVDGQSFCGIVKENDIITVNDIDYNQLITRKEYNKSAWQAVKKETKKAVEPEKATETTE